MHDLTETNPDLELISSILMRNLAFSVSFTSENLHGQFFSHSLTIKICIIVLELQIFQGKMLHTHDYKQPSGYEDKRIVVIGIGNSAGDVAVELAKCAKQVRV